MPDRIDSPDEVRLSAGVSESRSPALGNSALRPRHACRGGDPGRRRAPRRPPLCRSHRDRHSARDRHPHGLGAGSAMARGIAFSAKQLLEIAVALLGASLTFAAIGASGFALLGAIIALVVLVARGHLRHQPVARSAGSPVDPDRLRQLDLRQFGNRRSGAGDRRQLATISPPRFRSPRCSASSWCWACRC